MTKILTRDHSLMNGIAGYLERSTRNCLNVEGHPRWTRIDLKSFSSRRIRFERRDNVVVDNKVLLLYKLDLFFKTVVKKFWWKSQGR